MAFGSAGGNCRGHGGSEMGAGGLAGATGPLLKPAHQQRSCVGDRDLESGPASLGLGGAKKGFPRCVFPNFSLTLLS